MKAFHGDEAIKAKYLERVHAHALADEIVRGQYWGDGKGCAVGCTIHGSNHAAYETELGIPEWLARVEDTLFEGMGVERSKRWPGEFLEAITPGADLEIVKIPFIVCILERSLSTLDGLVFDAAAWPDVASAVDGSKLAVKQMIEAHKAADESAAWSAARSAESAAWSAESAAWSAARSAESAAWSAESAAWSAAWSAARSAESAAWSAESAAWSAARSAAWSAEYEYFADELLKLMRGCE